MLQKSIVTRAPAEGAHRAFRLLRREADHIDYAVVWACLGHLRLKGGEILAVAVQRGRGVRQLGGSLAPVVVGDVGAHLLQGARDAGADQPGAADNEHIHGEVLRTDGSGGLGAKQTGGAARMAV